MQPLRNEGAYQGQLLEKNPSLMPEKFKGKKMEKAGAVVEEEHLLSFVDIDEAYLSANMSFIDIDEA